MLFGSNQATFPASFKGSHKLLMSQQVHDLLDLTLTACIQHQLFLHGQLSDIQTAQINQLIEDLNRAATAAN